MICESGGAALADACSRRRYWQFQPCCGANGISQPAFSEAIRRIREELGVRLFNRTTRSLELTGDGRRILATARELVRDFKLALETIRADAAGRRSVHVPFRGSMAIA
jgi:DNA-binding transcriptional LysR family regulator